jgi:hypothetical protein
MHTAVTVEVVKVVYSRCLRLPLRINIVDRAMCKDFLKAEVNKEKRYSLW